MHSDRLDNVGDLTAKRFLVFSGYNHYPMQGWRDFRFAFATLEQAKAAVDNLVNQCVNPEHWAHVVDLAELKVVYEAGKVNIYDQD